MKRLILIILLLVFALSLFGCNSKQNQALVQEKIEEQSSLNEQPQYKIALVMKTLTNPFFIEMEKRGKRGCR